MSAQSESTHPTRRAKPRIDSIDVGRGAAIVLLFFNHGVILLDRTLPAWVEKLVYRASDVCIPMFMCISGLTMAYLLQRSGRPPAVVIRRYARRAIGLLIVTHVLITIGIWPVYWEAHSFVKLMLLRWHITDAIAICLLIGPAMILHLGDRWRLAIAVALPLLCRMVTAFWHPTTLPVAAGKELLFGIDDYDPSPALLNVYALGPYFAMFLLGTVLMKPMLDAVKAGSVPRFLRRLFVGCAVLLLAGLAWGGGYVLVAKRFLDPQRHGDWLGLLYPSKITGLLPIYLAMSGALFAVLVWRIEHRHRYGRGDFLLTVFGRTSLFAYVAQYFLIQGVPACLGWTGKVSVALFFPLIGLCTFILYGLSYLYGWGERMIARGEFAVIRQRVTRAAVPPGSTVAATPL